MTWKKKIKRKMMMKKAMQFAVHTALAHTHAVTFWRSCDLLGLKSIFINLLGVYFENLCLWRGRLHAWIMTDADIPSLVLGLVLVIGISRALDIFCQIKILEAFKIWSWKSLKSTKQSEDKTLAGTDDSDWHSKKITSVIRSKIKRFAAQRPRTVMIDSWIANQYRNTNNKLTRNSIERDS